MTTRGAAGARSVQAPAAVVMIRPSRFRPNPETRADNAFQSTTDDDADEALARDVAACARAEVTRAAETLEAAGVTTHVFDDTREDTPASVFPNNWFSTHPGGHVALYPMAVPSRRRERRADVIEFLKARYRVQDVIDYSGLEHDGLSLEGTGAMVLDHLDRVAYTARSRRADPVALERFCTHFNSAPMVFDAVDENGRAIYHTNVLMCIASAFAMIGLDAIGDPVRRREVAGRLSDSGREVIALDHEQLGEFAGNAIELQGRHSRLLALSSRALASLSSAQRAVIEDSCEIVPLDVPLIELAGGSVRCMLAGVHLTARSASGASVEARSPASR